MKRMKRIVAILMAAVMCLLMTVSVSAIVTTKGAYTFELKVLDAEGNVITEAAPGDTVYIGAFTYATEGKADVEIEASDDAKYKYTITVDRALVMEYAGADVTPFTNTDDEAYITDGGEDYGLMQISVVTDIVDGVTLSDSEPTSKISFVIPEGEKTYEFAITSCSLHDGTYGAKSIVKKGTTLTVAAKQETTPEFDGATGNVTEDGKIGIAATNGSVIYDNAYSVSVSIKNGENADKVGVKFIPSYVLTTNGDNWASAAEAVFTPGLGKGDNGFTAALINIPAKFRETGVEIQARAFMVVGGVEKLDENIVKKTVKWDITADRD